MDDRDSILLRDVGVDLALDELQLVQVFDGLAAVEYGEVARLGEGLGIQKPQLRGAVAQDEPVIVVSEPPAFAAKLEARLWLERRDVVGHPDVSPEMSPGVFGKLAQVPYGCAPPPSRSQLDQLAPPLGQAFAIVAAIHGLLLDDFAGLQTNLS